MAAFSILGAAVVTAVALSTWARVRFSRKFATFRCRIGPPTSRWRRAGARWQLGRRRAAWVSDVLLVRSGPLGSWVTPLATGVPDKATVRPMSRRTVRGLGPRPVALRLVGPDGSEFDVAVPEDRAAQVAGPFLLAVMPELPPAPRERGV
jgi:hypothetical protein